MKNISVLVLVCMVAIMPTYPLFAQEEETTASDTVLQSDTTVDEAIPTLYNETNSEETSTDVTTEDTTTVTNEEAQGESVVGADTEGDLTLDEYEVLVEQSETIDATDLDELDILSGEIVAVNEEENTVVIELEDGSLVTMPLDLVTSASTQFGGGRGKLLNPKPGDSLVLTSPDTSITQATVEIEEKTSGQKNVFIFIVTEDGKTKVETAQVPVYRNNQPSVLGALSASDSVQVVRNDTGDVLAIYATSTDSDIATETQEESSENNSVWTYVVVGGLLLILIWGYMLLGPKDKKREYSKD